MDTYTDCRTEEGITVGLIDSIITLARLLRTRKFKTSAIQQALINLRSDEDVAWITRKKQIIQK